ncbi:MAG: glutamine synthetase III [Chitinispirillaceae bacterium]
MSTRSEVTKLIGSMSLEPTDTTIRVSQYFAENTFHDAILRKTVSAKTFAAFKRWQDEGKVITKAQADEIANAMKDWAISKGATAYTHWFQPMTGLTAEKHDSFININGDAQVIEHFTGSKLLQGEPDASSFPSGGLRATFEARGYTAWDPSSPAFITEVELGKTLCIPSIFISYTGEALDKKLPLLRSDQALNKIAKELLQLFGDDSVEYVHSTCGAEQEYFLIDEAYARLRSDVMLCGRTLIGAGSPKGQQLEDQYFGSIKERVLNYMNDVAKEAYKLGIPVTTRHNEVAPHQFEFAPIFERSNLAADHNQLLMDIMKKVAKRHGMECLLHEKPFAGINGSGKHLNWSLADDKGNNLLNPGTSPEQNLLFLTVLVAVINGVYRHADLLRASVASAGNEHRLGANEAPPAIMSIYLGDMLSKILNAVESGEKKEFTKNDLVDLGIGMLPTLARDNTDRNRTSPFAFTGTKFEFRALGSSVNISTPITVLNSIVAESLQDMIDRIKKEQKDSEDFDTTVLKVLSTVIRESRPILFEGNNYSEQWVIEAATRGLLNEPSSPRALKAFIAENNVEMFERLKVFSKGELVARYNIWLDIYDKSLDIEARTLIEMVNTQVLPAAYDFQIEIGNSLDVLRDLSEDDSIPLPIGAVEDRKEMFARISADIFYVRKNIKELQKLIEQANEMSEEERSGFYFEELKPQLEHVRKHVDALESIMPDDLWLLPKYREMLFIA